MMRLLPLLLILSLVAVPAAAAPASEQWYSVLLDGRKIGEFESSREKRDTRVITRQRIDIELDRAGTKVSMGSTETSEETLDGKPLAFRTVSRMTGNETIVEGRVERGQVQARFRNAGQWSERVFAWPRGAMLPEGLRLAMLRTALEPGTEYSKLSFQPSSLSAVEITSRVGAREGVSLPDGRTHLTRIEQSFAFPGSTVRSIAWVDDEREIRKLMMPVLGVELTMLECDKACATAPNQAADVFERTLVRSPRALTRAELGRGLRYTLVARDGLPLKLPDTSEQLVVDDGMRITVDVQRMARAGAGDPPVALDYAANDWLQSDAPEIIELAERAVGDAEGDGERMRRLETFVRGFISRKTLSVGYASALEVARKPEGDCTEHAVLLAALGRALGIATRVVDGLAYAPGFAGSGNVFVPHAWVQAWIDGRWQSHDAALAGFDAGHIAFSAGDGDPWRFYQSLDLLGRIELERVKALRVKAAR